MTSVLPKIDPSHIHASDVELLVKAKEFLYAQGDIPQPNKETYICYAIQKAAGLENVMGMVWLAEFANTDKSVDYAAVIRLTVMVQMALLKHRNLDIMEYRIHEGMVSTSYGSIDEYAEYHPWDPAMRVHRHAWLDYMIATCKDYHK
jgi:hypothetical protein